VQKRAALEAAGWKVGDAADFLGLTEEEQQITMRRHRAKKPPERVVWGIEWHPKYKRL
jgi:transcriptional regulator with GAF, ATPase, and Fis domain